MTSLAEAKGELREQLMAGEAVSCPCCEQMAKIYKRQIHSAMAVALILLSRQGDDWVHFPTLLRDAKQRAGDEAKLAYWELIEPMSGERDDGSTRTGWWRITPLGRDFVNKRVRVAKYARVYDGRLLSLDDSDGWVGIAEALGDKFDYDQLMSH